jgi:hypothetical protein
VEGKTVVSKMPQTPQTSSEKQKERRHHFREAIIYAHAAIHAPSTTDVYAEAADDTDVTVSITNADALVEEGNALSGNDDLNWIYTATQSNANLDDDKIVVTVSALLQNRSNKEQLINAPVKPLRFP